MAFTTLFLVLFLVHGFPVVTGGKHSLLYLYTMESKTSYSHLYDCTAVTLLNDRQIDFYNSSSDNPRTDKQNWLKKIPESDWKTSTEKLQYDTQLLNILIDTQMSEFGHSYSDGHVLQWRHGCEGEQSSDGSLTVLNSINEFGYDGEDLIQFNCSSKTWITPEEKKNREREEKNREREKKWSKIFNVKKCAECEKILKMYSKNNIIDITQSHTPPAVHIFTKKSKNDPSKRILTCLITGFYPKDVKMSLRKFGTEIPEHLITSSGVRPNHNGTYQLRKSAEIQEDDPGDYYCYVNHSSLTEPVIKRWGERPRGLMIGVWVLASLFCVIHCVLMVMIINNGRSWVLNIGVAVLGVVIFLCFVILGVVMMINDERSWHSIIGCLVSGVVVFLILVIIYVVMIKKCARREAELRKHEIFVSGIYRNE